MRRSYQGIVVGVLILIAMAAVWFGVNWPGWDARRQRKAEQKYQAAMDLCQPAAMDFWPILAANQFKERQNEITKTFYCCFESATRFPNIRLNWQRPDAPTIQLMEHFRGTGHRRTTGSISWCRAG